MCGRELELNGECCWSGLARSFRSRNESMQAMQCKFTEIGGVEGRRSEEGIRRKEGGIEEREVVGAASTRL